MKFCVVCKSKLQRSTATGKIVYTCVCANTYNGEPEDTLLLEEQFEREQSNLKYNTFIENSAFDPTNMRVMRDCVQCKRNYMTLIRIGEQSKVLYTCVCGARVGVDSKTGGDGNRAISVDTLSVENIDDVLVSDSDDEFV